MSFIKGFCCGAFLALAVVWFGWHATGQRVMSQKAIDDIKAECDALKWPKPGRCALVAEQ